MKSPLQIVSQAVFCLLILFSACTKAPKTADGPLPRSVPEAEGISSEAILTFLDSVEARKIHEFHSIMILKHGKVVAEGWWSPYRSDLKHTLYSTSKSFTSTAVGFAVTEGLLTTDDKVVSFFPDELPEPVSPYLAQLTVKDLLSMTVGQDPDPTFLRRTDTNWVRSFLNVPVLYEPGSRFLYNSLATYMQSAIVQKVTGEKLIDYLTPRLFEPLGIEGMDWEEDPMGRNVGGWGLRIRTEDMAKFGQLFLQKGNWYGKQIIPASWVEEATTFKIDQAPEAPQSRKDSSDWMQGYCYQFWRCRHNAFRGDGAFGQYIIVMPDQDAVVAITSESPDMQDQINLVWDILLPAMNKSALPENKAAAEKLKERLASLTLAPPVSGVVRSPEKATGSISFTLEANDRKIEKITVDYTDSVYNMVLTTAGNDYRFAFGSGKWIEDETELPLSGLTGEVNVDEPFKVAGAWYWKDENTLVLVLRYIESPHSQIYTCRFNKDKVLLTVASSMGFGRPGPEIWGKIIKK